MSVTDAIARVPAHLAATQLKWGMKHYHPCDYWLRLDASDCTCDSRPVVDLLLAIVQKEAA